MSIGKVYPCDLCSKTFSRNGDLTRHKAIHSGEKNHVCNLCGMRFAQHSGLKTHRNTHTGEKPHQCEFCGKAFGDPSSCTRHEKEKHRAKPFQCYKCGSSIVRRSSFAIHLRKKHPDIRHLVTKEFLDEIEGPRLLKPRSRRGRRICSATMSVIPDPHVLAKAAGYYGHGHPRRTATVDDEIMAPVPTKYSTVMGLDVEKVERMSAVDNKAELEYTGRDTDALLLTFDAHGFGTSYADYASMSHQPVPQYTQSPTVYQHQQALDALDCGYGLPMYGGPPQYDTVDADGSTGCYDIPSASSSPAPITPTDGKPPPPAYVEPAKINPYDFSLYGTEEQHGPQYIAPPLYSYVPEQQDSLLYLGF